MSRDVAPEDVTAFWAHMTGHYGSHAIPKFEAGGMSAVGCLLDAIGVMDKDGFLRDYTTTIGRRIYTPFEIGVDHPDWDLWSQITVCTHEHQHVIQHNREGVRYELGYVTDTSTRARHEAEAYLTGVELRHWRYGDLPSPDYIAGKLTSYACTPGDVAWATQYLTLASQTVRLGGVVTEAGAFAIDWLNANAPELRDR